MTDASSYDARDRLTSAGDATLSWDEDGRMLSRSGPQGYTLGWDSQDRSLSVQYADGSRLDNTYDGDGVRVGFVETPACGTATVTSLRKGEKNLLPLQGGDVPATYANTDALRYWVGSVPATPVREGIGRFVQWYRDYYQV